MNKFKLFFVLIISFLTINIYVDAAIESGINAGVKGYVLKDSLIYNKNNSCNQSGSMCLGYTYSITDDSNATAFCIDPGLLSPDSNYKYYRELDLTSRVDQDFYKVYRYYVNNITAGGDKIDIARKTDVVLRMIIKNNGFDLPNNSATRDEQFFGVNGIGEYIAGNVSFNNINWTLGGNSGDKNANCKYWAGTSNLTTCEGIFKEFKDYYLSFLNYSDTWENALSITPKVTYTKVNDENDSYYTFNFEIKFNDGINDFFKDNNFNNGYGMNAYFKLNGFSYINDSYSIDGNAIEYSSIDVNQKITSNTSLNVYVKISEAVYNVIKANDPNNHVYVKLNYEYYHPLSEENVYLNSHDKTDEVSTAFQRMVIFDNFIHTDSVIASENSIVENTENVCKHNSDNTFIGRYGDIVSLETFKSQCGCSSINESYLNLIQKQYYNSNCSLETENVESNLNKCSVSSPNTEDYEIIYTTNSTINNYCSLSCKETIEFNDVVGKYNVKAGQIFTLNNYPKLIATKKCTVDVDYSNWETAYNNALALMVAAYNDLQKAKNTVTDSEYNACGCYRDWNIRLERWETICPYTEYTYNYSYTPLYINNNVNIYKSGISNGEYTESTCNTITVIDVDDKFNRFKETFAKIEELKNYLQSCSTKLSGVNNSLTDQLYYNFKQELKYYYAQTYSKNSIGTKWNDERISLNGVDDSGIDFTYEKKSSDGNYRLSYGSSGNYVFDSIDENGNISTTDLGLSKSNISRDVIYEYNYTKSTVYKYADAFTGKISSNRASLSNPVSLGYVYDTDVTAVAKSKNDNKFLFLSLGDNNKIYNYLKTNNRLDDLERYCEYEISNDIIKNDIIKNCEGINCDSLNLNDSKLNILYRIVDPSNVDPNNRFGTEDGFKNWNSDIGKAVKAKIESDAVGNNTYTPNNLEYSFELDSATIEEIREYNETHNYSDFEGYYDCDNGDKCKSDFVNKYAIKDGLNEIVGRSTWKEFRKNSTGKCFIDDVEVACS